MAGVVLFILGAVGLALIARGIAGRRVGEEPRCRGCRYDLSGIRDKAESCPECGSSLSASGAVVHGLRKRLLASIAVGLLFMSASLGFVGVSVWAKANDFDFNTIKPTWLLLREVEANKDWSDEALTAEITKRLNAGTLSDRSIERIVQIVIDTEPDWRASVAAQFDQTWSNAFVGLLAHPNTTPRARSRLTKLSFEYLSHQPGISPATSIPADRHEVIESMVHLLSSDLLTERQAQSFLAMLIQPTITLWNSNGTANRPVLAQLGLDWLRSASPNSFSLTPVWMMSSPWGSRIAQNPAIQVMCKTLAGDSAIVRTKNTAMYFTQGHEIDPPWVVGNDATTSGYNVPPWRFQLTLYSNIAHLRTPTRLGTYQIAFEVRITLLKPDPANPLKHLEPDDTNISVVHRIEVPLIVESYDEVSDDDLAPDPGPVQPDKP